MTRVLTLKVVNRFFPRYVPASERPEKLFRFPELRPSDLENARLFADRQDLVKNLVPKLQGGRVAEVGVLYGDFSEFLVHTIEPELFVAIDRFDLHLVLPARNDKVAVERFQGMTHRAFYEKRFSERGKQVRCEQGHSWEVLAKFPDGTFDLIYVDAGHDYKSVKRDADLSVCKIKAGGLIIFNDYIKYSHYEDSYYGVIPAVNELVVNQGFKVVGFALQADMYGDIAVRPGSARNST